MGNIKSRLFEYLRLLRLQTGAATASAPLIGALVMGQRDISLLVVLFIIGILYHIYGFVLNEYVDAEGDKKSSDLQKKPLVSGNILRKNARFIIIASCVCACALTIVFFPTLLPMLFLLLALALGGIYDVYGKKILGSDFILGGSFFFIGLSGASTVSYQLTSLAYVVCLLYFVQIVFNNAVEGGLKDVGHDFLAGAKTLAVRMGVKIKEERLVVTKMFMVFSYGLRIVFIVLLGLLFFQQEVDLWSNKYVLHMVIVAFLAFILFFTLYAFLTPSRFDRSRLMKLFSVHEMSSYFMLLIVLSPLFGLQITMILLLLPSVWYLVFNVVLYGKLLQPQV